MARLSVIGLDEFMNDLEEVAKLPDGVVFEILNKQAEVVEKAQANKITELGLVDTGQLRDSISRSAVRSGGASRYLEVFPQGERRYGGRNAEVGFIQEYGAPGRHITAKSWMYDANEECAEETTEAALKVYDNYLKSKNL